MTITAREMAESQNVDKTRTILRGRRQFDIFDDAAAPAPSIDGVSALAATGLPTVYKGGASPTDADLPAEPDKALFPGFSNLFCVRLFFEHRPSGSNQYVVTAFYEGFDSAETVEDPQIASQLTFQDVWRSNPTPPEDPEFGNPAGTDIGGGHIDFVGRPIPRPAAQALRRFSRLFMSTDFAKLPWLAWAKSLGARNSEKFITADPFQLQYVATSTHKIGEQLSVVTHELLFDANFHFIQKPDLESDGQPRKDVAPGDTFSSAIQVEWRPSAVLVPSVDFAALFSTGMDVP